MLQVKKAFLELFFFILTFSGYLFYLFFFIGFRRSNLESWLFKIKYFIYLDFLVPFYKK